MMSTDPHKLKVAKMDACKPKFHKNLTINEKKTQYIL